MRKKLIEPSQNSYYSDENSLMEEEKRNEVSGSLFSKNDRESLYNQASIKDLNNKSQQVNISVYQQENNEIIEQIKKKKGGPQDENVKKMDKSCDVCRIM